MAAKACFRPEHRLHRAEEFSAVFSYRKVVRSSLFDLHWRPREAGEQVPARLGLVVPKRLVRRAVLRNLIKRLAREVFRHQDSALAGYDLVLKLGRKPVLDGDKAERNALLRADIEAAIGRFLQRISPVQDRTA